MQLNCAKMLKSAWKWQVLQKPKALIRATRFQKKKRLFYQEHHYTLKFYSCVYSLQVMTKLSIQIHVYPAFYFHIRFKKKNLSHFMYRNKQVAPSRPPLSLGNYFHFLLTLFLSCCSTRNLAHITKQPLPSWSASTGIVWSLLWALGSITAWVVSLAAPVNQLL